MKNKGYVVKLTTALLVVTMLALCLSFGTVTAEENAVGDLVTIRFATYVHTRDFPVGDAVTEYVEKKFNIKLEMITAPHGADYGNKIVTMVSSGDIPDVFDQGSVNIREMYEAGMALCLDDYKDKAPSLAKYLDEARPVTNLKAYGDKFYFSPKFIDYYGHGIHVRGDWLKKLGLEVPKTMDEFYEACKAFKEKDPDGKGAVGLTLPFPFWLSHIYSCYTGAFIDFYAQDGQVNQYYVHPGMKDAWAFLAKMYGEDLIDKNMFTGTSQESYDMFGTGRAGFLIENVYSEFYNQINEGLIANYPEAEHLVIRFPAGPAGAHQISGNGYLSATLVNANGTDPERVVQLMDWVVSDEGKDILRYGIEGVHYTLGADGTRVRNEDEYLKGNFNIGNAKTHMLHYLMWQDPMWFPDAYPNRDMAIKLQTDIAEGVKEGYVLLPLVEMQGYSSDVGDKISPKCWDVFNEYQMKFITGEIPVDDTTWAQYLKALDDAGYQELRADQQTYYDLSK